MRTGDICSRDVVVAGPDETVVEAARLMREYHVGDLVIVRAVDGENVPVAVLTDRDLVIEVLAKVPERASELTIGDVLVSTELATVTEDQPVSDCIEVMKRRRVRRLPVLSASGALVGIVTYDDLVELIGGQLGDLAEVSHRQIATEQRKRS